MDVLGRSLLHTGRHNTWWEVLLECAHKLEHQVLTASLCHYTESVRPAICLDDPYGKIRDWIACGNCQDGCLKPMCCCSTHQMLQIQAS